MLALVAGVALAESQATTAPPAATRTTQPVALAAAPPLPRLSPSGPPARQARARADRDRTAPRRTRCRSPSTHPPRAGLLFNLDTGQVLWQRNPFMRLRIASLTKMMTALLTVESAPPDAHVLVTRQAVDAAGSKVGVLPLGKHVRLESMLYGLLLPSGNDAAVALAQHVAGSVAASSRA